mmetsp:Transcript_21158/g.42186  ORF Transcript_21158/g.42186 Transcript_21158/m.42186 type:complete len:372 (+) Transcript_21158:118-1233(+)
MSSHESLSAALDVPSLRTGTSTWSNIQPLLRHAFLTLYDNVASTAKGLEDWDVKVEEMERRGKRDGEDVKAYVKQALEASEARWKEEVTSLKLEVVRLTKDLESERRARASDLQRLRAELESEMGRERQSGNDLQGSVVKKIVGVESTVMALSERLDGVAGEVDKISFPRRNSGGIQNHNPDVNVVMMDLNRIRKDLSFKCDGSFVKTSLEAKANKQSVADALHSKANKRTVTREFLRLEEKLTGEVKLLKEKINSAYTASSLPVGKITLALKQVANEVREGVRDSRDGLEAMTRRIDSIETGIGLSMAAATQQRRYEPPPAYTHPPPDLRTRRQEQVFYPRQPPAQGREEREREQEQERRDEESAGEDDK